MNAILVTGTPGTGKSTLSLKLSEKLGFTYIDVNKIIKKYSISEGYDKKRKSKIIDTSKLNMALRKEIVSLKNKKDLGVIIDSHLSHHFPKSNICIVTKCGLKVLERRLKKRKYTQEKIRENIDSEIFDVCYNEAVEKKHKTLVVDTTKGSSITKVIKEISKHLK